MSYPICKHDHSAHNFPCPSCEQDERIRQLERELAAEICGANNLLKQCDELRAQLAAVTAERDALKAKLEKINAELAKEGK